MIFPTAMPAALPACGANELAEGPVWDERRSRLYWVDITAGALRWLDAAADRRESLILGGTVGFVALTEEPDTVILGHGRKLKFLTLSSRSLEPVASLEPAGAPLRCNDGKCDPAGRLWAGTMRWGGDGGFGGLFSLDGDLTPVRRLAGLRIANGLAWHAGRGAFYFIDSPTRRIARFDWRAENGAIEPAGTLAEFAVADGSPDGMTIDAGGNLWVAFWGGSCVRRIDGVTGRTLATIDLPVTQPSSCTFGGPDGATLFITTAAADLTAVERERQPLAGAVFAVRPGVRGLRCDRFAGANRRPAR